jgi:hypothetical protein
MKRGMGISGLLVLKETSYENWSTKPPFVHPLISNKIMQDESSAYRREVAFYAIAK